MTDCCCCKLFLYVAAAYVAVKVLFWLKDALFGLFLRPKSDLRQYGEWALITGCTNGIGEALTHVLAKRKFNTFLVGRNPEALSKLAAEIESRYGVKTSTFQVDAASPDAIEKAAEIGQAFSRLTHKRNAGIVINCAGLSYEHPEYFVDTPAKRHTDIVSINSTFLTALTHAVLPAIAQGGIVLNVSSLGGAQEEPLLATYAASKAFVTNLSAALDAECAQNRDYNVRVQALCPGMVVSNMSKVKKPSLACPSAKMYAEAVVDALGVGSSTLVVHWPHYLQYLFLTSVPSFVAQKVLWNMHADIRRRALKKKQREASAQ